MIPGLPVVLVRVIEKTFRLQRHQFTPDWAVVYEGFCLEEFNALLEAEMLSLQMMYRFSPSCHADWVCPSSSYIVCPAIGNEGYEAHQKRPLNSWILKDPVGLVPSLDCLVQEMRWRAFLSKTLLEEKAMKKNVEKLRAWYIREACKEIVIYERLLLEWYRLGGFQEQSEWRFPSKEGRKCFREAIKFQRRNALDAREKFELLQRTGAPEFLLSRAAGESLREKRLLDQMHEALLLCG